MSASADDLTRRVRARALAVLLVYTFFMVAGFTMLMPLVAVHFINHAGMAATLVGGALAVRQLTQQGLAVIGGLLADRYGIRPMICVGVLLRAAGFALLACAETGPTLFAALILSALGGALFEAPYQAAMAALTTEANRTRYYAISNWVAGVATTLGPLVGIALLRLDFQVVCLSAAACFLLNFGIAWLLPPALKGWQQTAPTDGPLRLVLRDRRYLLLTAILVGYWILAVQINISFPLLAERLHGGTDGVGVMFAVSALLTVLFQYALVRAGERWLSPPNMLIVGVLMATAGTGLIAMVSGFGSFLLCVALFSVGGILVRPAMQHVIASMADPRALGTFLGVSSLSLALGGAIGNIAGGWLVDLGQAQNWPALPWLIFGAIGLACAASLFCLIGLSAPRAKPSRPQQQV